jgi:hypothetical protein
VDPQLYDKCKESVETICADVEPGSGNELACLVSERSQAVVYCSSSSSTSSKLEQTQMPACAAARLRGKLQQHGCRWECWTSACSGSPCSHSSTCAGRVPHMFTVHSQLVHMTGDLHWQQQLHTFV